MYTCMTYTHGDRLTQTDLHAFSRSQTNEHDKHRMTRCQLTSGRGSGERSATLSELLRLSRGASGALGRQSSLSNRVRHLPFEVSARCQLADGWTGGLYHVRNRKANRMGIRLRVCFSASTWHRCRLNVAISRWRQTLRATLVAARFDLHVNVRSTGGHISKNLQQDLLLLVLLPLVARTSRPPHSRGMMRSCDSAGGVGCGA